MKNRPAAVAILGGVYIIGSFTVIVLAAFQLLMWGHISAEELVLVERTEAPEGAAGELVAAFAPVEGILRNIDSIMLAVIAFCAATIFCSVYFIMLRAWARAALEAVTWAALVSILGFGAFWLKTMISINSAAAGMAGEAPPNLAFTPAVFGTTLMVVGAVITVIHAAVPAVFIFFLRTRSVRDAMIRL